MNPISHDLLELGDCLGSGGQGTVHRVLNRKINGQWPVAYKEYNAAAQDAVDIDALRTMVELIPALSGSTAEWLCTTAAWPAAVVERQGRVSGFLMRTVPDEYYFDYCGFDRKVTRKLATAEFLLNDDAYTRSIGLSVDERERLRLLADLAAKLSRLHALGIAVGDLSPKNLLFATESPNWFLIDCDAMRINGRSVLPQVETPDWQLPVGEEKGTASSDAYKLALLAVRVFARDQASRDPQVLPATAEPKLVELARAALHGQCGDRPAPNEWAEYCLSAAYSPKLVIAPWSSSPGGTRTAGNSATAAQGRAGKPGGSGRSARAWQAIAAAAAAAVLTVVVIATSDHGRHAAANPTPAASTSSSPAPHNSKARSRPPRKPVSDPRKRSTDLTPFTVGALLPDGFTDSDREHFTLRAAGPKSCITRDQTGSAQNILTRNNCVRQMVGTYVNHAGTILVSVEVMPMASQRAARRVFDAVKRAGDLYAGDLGFWCPDRDVRRVCDSSYFSAATKWWEYSYNYRYFVNAVAIWINLSQDRSSRADDPLRTAVRAAVLAAEPASYSGSS